MLCLHGYSGALAQQELAVKGQDGQNGAGVSLPEMHTFSLKKYLNWQVVLIVYELTENFEQKESRFLI